MNNLAYSCCILNLGAEPTNHCFQPSQAAYELELLRYCPVSDSASTRDTARYGEDTLDRISGALGAWMVPITAHFTTAAIDAIPYFQGF
jgi:hypothetical protein